MIQRRSMWKQVLLFIVTLGIYSIYWYYVTCKEMVEFRKLDGRPGLWTILLFVPFANLYSYWKYGQVLENVTDGRYPAVLTLILWWLFSPAVWLIAQMELNKIADQQAEEERPEGVEETEPTSDDQKAGEDVEADKTEANDA